MKSFPSGFPPIPPSPFLISHDFIAVFIPEAKTSACVPLEEFPQTIESVKVKLPVSMEARIPPPLIFAEFWLIVQCVIVADPRVEITSIPPPYRVAVF